MRTSLGRTTFGLRIWTTAVLSAFLQVCPVLSGAVHLGFNFDTWLSRVLRYDYALQHVGLKKLRDSGVSRVKVFSANRYLISAIHDTWGKNDLRLMIAVGNDELAALARGQPSFQQEQLDELMSAVAEFSSRIEFLAIGNEVEYPATNNRQYAPLLLPVLQTIHSELQRRGLGHVRLTCPFSDVLIISPGNPSESDFVESYDSAMSCNEEWCKNHTKIPMLKWVLPALDFLNRTGGAFCTTLYPFYKWRNLGNPDWCVKPGYGPCTDQSLAFAVGATGAEQQRDSKTGLNYEASLEVMIDQVRYALARHGYGNLQFIVGETGWPTAGIAYTSKAASCWAANTAARVATHGTPASRHSGDRPPLIYHFQWIDEKGKFDYLGKPVDPGPTEDHFGVLDTSLKFKYPLDFSSGRAACEALPEAAYKGMTPMLPHPQKLSEEGVRLPMFSWLGVGGLIAGCFAAFVAHARRTQWHRDTQPGTKLEPLLITD